MPEQVNDTAVKALSGDGRVGGYLVVWGDAGRKDLQGEYFTPNTDLGLDWYPRRPVLYQHGLDGDLGPELIGHIESMKADATGLWVEAQLNMHNHWAEAVLKLVQRGAISWSSGSLPHLVQVDGDGHIRRWPLVEGSLTPTPAEPRQTNVAPIKHFTHTNVAISAYKSAGLDVSDLLEPDAAAESGEGGEQTTDEDGETSAQPDEIETLDEEQEDIMSDTLTREDILAIMKEERERQAETAERQALEARAAAAKEAEERAAKAEAELEAAKAQLEERQQEPAKRLPGRTTDLDGTGQRPARVLVGSKFDDLSVADMAFGVTIMQQSGAKPGTAPVVPSEQYARAFASKLESEGITVVDREGHAMKSDELSHSTQASYGDEWVPTLWESEVWRKARQDNVILPLFRTIEMPSNPFELPIEGTDPTVYYVPETTDESQLTIAGSGAAMPDSKVGSGKVTLSAKKLAVRIGFSSELVEDSLIPIIPMFREQAVRTMADSVDYMLLNGDTTDAGTGNINSDDADPANTSRFLAFDGLRHLPLVTTTAQAVDASGGSPTVSLLRSVRAAMPGRYGLRAGDLTWIVDGATYMALLNDNQLVTIDKYGIQATVLTGEVGKVDGITVLSSAEMSLTEADGKISATPGNNTLGQGVLVYRPGWVVGYRRRVAATMTYMPYTDSYQLVATMRLAFINFDSYVSGALYNIGV